MCDSSLGQFVAHQLQGLLAAGQFDVAGTLDLRLDLLVRFLRCLEEMSHVLESALNIVKRRFRFVAHAGLKGALQALTATKTSSQKSITFPESESMFAIGSSGEKVIFLRDKLFLAAQADRIAQACAQ